MAPKKAAASSGRVSKEAEEALVNPTAYKNNMASLSYL
jgi:hypothetical protein